MRPFDEEPDYSDVALLVASVREWPSDDFARDLDARVARRFDRSRLGPGPAHPGWVGGAGSQPVLLSRSWQRLSRSSWCSRTLARVGWSTDSSTNGPALASAPHASQSERTPGAVHSAPPAAHYGAATNTTATFGAPTSVNGASSAGAGQLEKPTVLQSASSDRVRSRGPWRQTDPIGADQPDDPEPARQSGGR